ncbi:Protein of unknown function [Rhodospirillales bacterium URHD0017]|nr:Protein of unknown function [Rhodospirillales bacterium URHD0017]
MEHGAQGSEANWRAWLVRTPLGWGLSLAVAAAGLYLLVTHTGHVLVALPYLLLMACPLMHFLHGHGQHDHGDHGKT